MVREILFPIVAAVLAAAIAHSNAGCMPADYPSVSERYAADIQACARDAATFQESHDCRAVVNRAYGLCEPEQWPRVTPCD